MFGRLAVNAKQGGTARRARCFSTPPDGCLGDERRVNFSYSGVGSCMRKLIEIANRMPDAHHYARKTDTITIYIKTNEPDGRC